MRMPQLPKTIYTRRDWQIPSGPMAGKYGNCKPATAEHAWVPKSKMKLREAVSLLGEKQIDGWDGSEGHARRFDNPPEQPWLNLGTEDPAGCLIFDDDCIPRFVDKESAEAWWSKLETELFAEWEAEQDAAERWELALSELRSLLAERILHAELLPESGGIIHVDPDDWLSWKAKSFFRTGVGEITRANEFHVASFKGIFLIDRSRLEDYFSPDTEKSQAQSANAEIDPASRVQPSQR